MKVLRPLCWLAVVLSSIPTRADGLKPELLHGFSAGVPNLTQGVVPGPDGNFYGVASSGGRFGRGTFFRVEPSMSSGPGTITILANFGDPQGAARGANPAGQLAFDGLDKFYGVTSSGGRSNCGTVFRVALDGTVETLVDFSGYLGAAIGINPAAGLVRANDGNFYGTTANGGPDVDNGTVFRVSPEGRFQTILNFTGTTGKFPGAAPGSPLLKLADGTLVGTTFYGGKAAGSPDVLGFGTIFRLTILPTSVVTFASVAAFTGPTGALKAAYPVGRLAQTPSGAVYGLFVGPTEIGSAAGIWQLPLVGAASRLLTFSQASNGGFISSPTTGLAVLASGKLLVAFQSVSNGDAGGLFSVSEAGVIDELSLFDSIAPPITTSYYTEAGPLADGAGGFIGSIFGSLYQADANGTPTLFAIPLPDGGTGTGATPNGQVVFAQDGTLYGYASEGGTSLTGTVFKRPSSGPLSLLAALPSDFIHDDSQPLAFEEPGSSVLLTQSSGGTEGKGRILQIDSSGIVNDRASFRDSANVADTPARFPKEGLLSDGSGNFYGLAMNSGSSFDDEPALYRFSGPLNIIFRVAPLGLGQTFIEGGLALDGSGNLLGALPEGGTNESGAIFRVTPAGAVTTLVEFGGSASPAGSVNPRGPLLPEPGGSFLFLGGVPTEDAINKVLRLKLDGTVELVAELRSEDVAGAFQRVAPLARDSQGRVYALLSDGGFDSGGVLVRIDGINTFTVAYEFRGGAQSDAVGFAPSGGLKLGPDGALYGVTARGGPQGGGALFRFATTTLATGSTTIASDVLANSVTLNASLMSNGYGGEYWFTYGEGVGPLDQETTHVTIDGFYGTQMLEQTLTALRGHRTYTFQFHARVGFGSDAVTITGTPIPFTLLNGKPQPQTDAILAESATDAFVGDVLANDLEPDGDPLTIDSYTQGSLGSVDLVGSTLVYTPGTGFIDRDSFTYTVSDGLGETATATVNVMVAAVVSGEYAGLLFEDDTTGATAAAREGAPAAAAADRLAAGFASLALTRRRTFTARFELGARSIPVRGRLAADRDTTVRGDRDRLSGQIRTVPAGVEGRITFNGRTLILRAGQGFFAAGVQRPASAFTVRFTPDEIADPIAGDGLPAGSGFGLIRQGRTARATLIGVLPDGTAFSKKSTVDPGGLLPFFSQPYKGKTGVIDGTLHLAGTGEVDAAAGTTTRWEKPVLLRQTRFATGFSTTLTAFGGRYTPQTPPLNVPDGSQVAAAFDRGGLFAALESRFDIVNGRPRPDPASNVARATLSFAPRTGLFSGAIRPVSKRVKFRGVLIQRDNRGAGFFLGTTDAGSVQLTVVP